MIELHPTAITGVIECAAGLRQFRAVHEPEALVVSVVREADADAGELCAGLTEALRGVLRAGRVDCRVRVDVVERIEPHGVAGKMKLVEGSVGLTPRSGLRARRDGRGARRFVRLTGLRPRRRVPDGLTVHWS